MAFGRFRVWRGGGGSASSLPKIPALPTDATPKRCDLERNSRLGEALAKRKGFFFFFFVLKAKAGVALAISVYTTLKKLTLNPQREKD